MAQVVFGGSREYRMLVSGEQHPNTAHYLRNQMTSLQSYIGNSDSSWAQRAIESYNRFSSEHAVRLAQAALRKVDTYFQEDRIMQLDTLAQLQQAGLRMQRFIIANPYVRERYHNQMCDGYQGTYVDMHPQDIGPGHYDYDRVMDGLIVETAPTEEDPDGSWVCRVQTDEEILPGDVKLNLVQNDMILTSWATVEHLMRYGEEDPVSPSGGML